MAYTNNNGQTRVGIRSGVLVAQTPSASTLWNSLYSAYNADSIGSSSLKTSLYAAYNGESNANDSFGTNNGTAQGGLTYTTGKIGDAFQFNGTNAYVSLPNNSFNPTGDFTISAWVNFATNTGYNIIYSSYSSGGTWGNGVLFYREGATNNWSFDMRNGSGILLFRTPDIGGPTNKWVHMVVVRVVGQDPKFYMNGSLVTGTFYTFGNSSINPSYGANQICNLGGYDNGSFLGNFKQDGTSLWNRALSASEITELYNSGNGAQYIGDNFYKPTTNDALNTYNGTAQGGLTYGLGKVGTAFQFNGTNAYVSLPNSSGQFNFTGDFSVSMWFKSSNLSTSRYAISNYKSGGSYYGYGWCLYYSLAGGFAFDLRNGNNINQVRKIQTINTNTWYHVVAVRKMGQIHKLYVNGIDTLATQTDGNVNNIAGYTANQPMDLGGMLDINIPALCDLDGVNMWNRELSQAEVTELYNSGNGKQYPN